MTNISGTIVEELEELRQTIEKNVRKLKKPTQVKDFLEGRKSLKVFQWELLNNLKNKGKSIDLENDYVAWIYNNKDALETLLTSGDIENDKWKEAIEIVAEIIKQDPTAKSGLHLKLAIAVGLTFSNDVRSMADGSTIDGIARYHNYAQWADDRLLFEPFYNLSAWQMRYVVGSWAKDEELVWARDNVHEDYRDPNKIGSATHSMVEYKLFNDDGISVHDSGYYYGKPVTLEWIHTIGGVCGAISKFGSGMAQAFGIPGLPVGQPGHCAFIWLKNGTEWHLDNDISGWTKSSTHSGIQYTWKVQSPFFTMMNEAQVNPDAYRLSEKMRILATSFVDSKLKFSILEDATVVCPQNYDLWNELQVAISEHAVDKAVIEPTMLPYLEEYEKINSPVKNVAWKKPVTASESEDATHVITDGSREWRSTNAISAWVEIDLGVPCSIDEFRIHWWGVSYSDDYDILAQIDNEFVKVRTRLDEEREDTYYNPWGLMAGWDGMTTKIRLELRDGAVDPWYGIYYFGIRQIILIGQEHKNTEIISGHRPVTTSSSTGQKLVDGELGTYWTSNARNSWITISFRGLCVVDQVSIYWLHKSLVQGRQTVQYVVGGKLYKEKKGKIEKVEMQGFAGDLRVILRGSKNYFIREIEARGYCYSTKDIFKMKLPQGFATPQKSYTAFIIEDIFEIIGRFECDSCF